MLQQCFEAAMRIVGPIELGKGGADAFVGHARTTREDLCARWPTR
jgi:hypothetical protein